MENTYLPVILSSRLREIFTKINDNVSNFILSLENNRDYNFQFSFFDITDDESTISFIQANKYEEIPKTRGNGDFVWSCSARNSMRFGKLINKIAPFYSSVEIEKCVNAFKAEYKNSVKNIKFKIVEGNEIAKYYNGKRYARGNGSLNKSCMRHDHCIDFLELYIKNPEKIKMVILLESKDVIGGRALLWKLDHPADAWLMDRIYVKDDSDAILFKKFAEKKGWLYKHNQTFDCTHVVENNKTINKKMVVKLNDNFDYRYYPYIDTLYNYDKVKKYLTNDEQDYETNKNIIKLREINGSDSGNINFVYDDLNKEIINIEDAVYCQLSMGYTHVKNAVFMKEYDEYVFSNEIVFSKLLNKNIPSRNTVFSKVLDSILPSDMVTRVFIDKNKNYDYYLIEDYNKKFVNMGNSFYIIELVVKGLDGNYHFKDEYDENILKEILKSSTSSHDLLAKFLNSKTLFSQKVLNKLNSEIK